MTITDDETPTLHGAHAVPPPRYRLLGLIAEGGMGEVYRGEDTQLRRPVAIKTVRAEVAKIPEMMKRIERECLLQARMGAHPHIVTLYDRFDAEGQVNLVMEYVEGRTLDDLIDEGRKTGRGLTASDIIRVIMQVLRALADIHACGVIHRDIKPRNIMVRRSPGGEPLAKLLDFGIARAQFENEQATKLTQGGGLGTPYYMAPEQIDPESFGEICPATDVYATGVTLYHALTGSVPFAGTYSQVILKHIQSPMPPPSFPAELSIGPSLTRILARAMEKQPSDRYATASEFYDALEKVLSAAPTLSLPERPSGIPLREPDVQFRDRPPTTPPFRSQTAPRDFRSPQHPTHVRPSKAPAIAMALFFGTALLGGGVWAAKQKFQRQHLKGKRQEVMPVITATPVAPPQVTQAPPASPYSSTPRPSPSPMTPTPPPTQTPYPSPSPWQTTPMPPPVLTSPPAVMPPPGPGPDKARQSPGRTKQEPPARGKEKAKKNDPAGRDGTMTKEDIQKARDAFRKSRLE